MAQEAIERPEESEELQNLLHSLSQEIALRDSLVFKKEKLLQDEEAFIQGKQQSLRDDYQSVVEDINALSQANTSKEIQFMDEFTNEVKEFNLLCGDFVADFIKLKKVGEVK